MLIVYDSLTGKSKQFTESLNIPLPIIDINKVKEIKDEKIFLITRSFNYGDIPITTSKFLSKYATNVVGMAVSGNRAWGDALFGLAGDRIKEQYPHIELVTKFELMGLESDRKVVREWLIQNS